MEEISINETSTINLLTRFYSAPVKFNDSYLIEKKDTLISFEMADKSGLIWIVTKTHEIDDQDISFVINNNFSKNVDGTYKDYVISLKPTIRVSYSQKNVRLDDQCKFIYDPGKRNNSTMFDEENRIWGLILHSPLELRNGNDKLVYRVELGEETELFVLNRKQSLCCVFFQ